VPESLLSTDAELIAHPGMASGSARRIFVGIAWRREEQVLTLRYRLDGDIDRLVVPAPAAPRRTNGLWQHTCFEAFVRPVGQRGYCEFNFAPSGEWAAYRFTARRAGMRELETGAPVIRCTPDDGGMSLDVTLDASAWTGPIDLGLAAVIEDRAGSLAYWALAHPADRPDFHDPESFALRFEPTRSVTTAGGAA